MGWLLFAYHASAQNYEQRSAMFTADQNIEKTFIPEWLLFTHQGTNNYLYNKNKRNEQLRKLLDSVTRKS